MRSPSDILEERRKELGLSGISKNPFCIYCGDEIAEKQSCIMFGSYSFDLSHLNYAHLKCAKKYGWKVKEGRIMSSKLVKKFTCDFCGKSSREFNVDPCDPPDFWPEDWGTLFYNFTDEKGNSKACTLDICECCLANDDTHVVIYPNKMRKYMYKEGSFDK